MFLDFPEAQPEHFRLQAEGDRYKLIYHRWHWPFLVVFFLGMGLGGSLLGDLPDWWKSLVDLPSWTWSYPENLAWLLPLLYFGLLFAFLGTGYAGLALFLDQRVLEITSEYLRVYEFPLPLHWPQTIFWEEIAEIHSKKYLTGVGNTTTQSYPVYFHKKNNKIRALGSYETQEEAEFIQATLSYFLHQLAVSQKITAINEQKE